MTTADFVREQVIVADALRVEGQHAQSAELLRGLIAQALDEIDDLVDQRNALEEIMMSREAEAR